MNVGEKIKSSRKKRGLTQIELGELIGKSGSSVKKYESGQITIPLDTLNDIAHVLSINLRDLIDSNNSSESLELFKRYLESKKHFITDDKLLKEMEIYISEYIEFKLYKNNNLD